MKTTTILDAEGRVLALIDHHRAGHAFCAVPTTQCMLTTMRKTE
jgi:hypothetical protein